VLLAAARAYCEAKFTYDGPYVSAQARERHIVNDMLSMLEEPWFPAVVDAAYRSAGEVGRCDTR
jgi:hypothetical protein